MRAGSLPTSGSVSKNALISLVATRGKKRFFCSSVPNSLSGWGTPIDWWALSRVLRAECAEPAMLRARL